jgi:hypothetical protein
VQQVRDLDHGCAPQWDVIFSTISTRILSIAHAVVDATVFTRNPIAWDSKRAWGGRSDSLQ